MARTARDDVATLDVAAEWQSPNRVTARVVVKNKVGHRAAADPRYADGSGSDEVVYRMELPADVDPSRLQVRATLYYQAVPPYYLRNLFETAPDGPATRRLHAMFIHLDLKGRRSKAGS